MPPKADTRDWDRLFKPGAPRRGGPLRALSNVLLTMLVLALLSGGAYFALRFGVTAARNAAIATQTAIATSNAGVLARQTADAGGTATAAAAAAATTPTATAEPAPLGTGSVLAGGNLRGGPEIRDDNILGQICPGDQIAFLEQATAADGQVWYRIRLNERGPSCSAQHVSIGTPGWASATLLSQPTP